MNGYEQPQSKTKLYVIAGSIAALVVGLIVIGIVVYRARSLAEEGTPTGEQASGTGAAPSAGTGGLTSGAQQPSAGSAATTNPSSAVSAEAIEKAEASNQAPDYTGGVDTDGDRVPDGVEAAYRTDPTKSDTDGDGYSDYDEIYVYGTDPVDGSKDPKTSEGLFKPNK